jgi:sulfate adenylyltransferase large subunit/phosphoadenylyl-sulfate reductase (thioredoxin)
MNIRVIDHRASAQANRARALVRVVVVGHVDHGKSTLIGRLLHETKNLADGKLESLQAVSARRGIPFEWSFLLDALQTERDQGITIDTSQIYLRLATRDVVLIDAPGHTEFLRNMITGAAQADAALLLIDAAEGVREQTRRHGHLLHLLGVRQVAVVINKMDRVDFDAARFRAIEAEIVQHLSGLGVIATAVIPISARNGDGVAERTPAIAWHTGPTVIEALNAFAPARPTQELALRLPVQAVYKFDERRIIAGRVETGRLAVNDEILVMPSGKTARVRTIEAWPAPDAGQTSRAAVAGQSIGITLDREIFVGRGDIVAPVSTPPQAARRLRARVFWLHEAPLAIGDAVTVRIGTAEATGTIAAIEDAIDPGKLSSVGSTAIAQNHIGEIEIALARPIAADAYGANPRTGRVVLDLAGRIAGGGLILDAGAAKPAASVMRAKRSSGTAADPAEDLAKDLVARAAELESSLAGLPPAERLARLRQSIDGRIVFTTSFGLEDQAIIHLLRERAVDADVVTLDTGRLFPETYALWEETERRYGLHIRAIYPQHAQLEALVVAQGINGFYGSRDARLACCHVRKVEPLNRALEGANAWIVGLRADQSSHRQGMGLVTADTERGLIKVSPFFDWTRDAILSFATNNNIPINPLHAQGFASIGCAPCTRAIAPGEPERAGRWWWEQEEKKECGLHNRGPAPAIRVA